MLVPYYLINDRINKIKFDIEYLKKQINIHENIISNFNKLPHQLRQELDNTNKNGKSFISEHEYFINTYKNQLDNLNAALKELEEKQHWKFDWEVYNGANKNRFRWFYIWSTS